MRQIRCGRRERGSRVADHRRRDCAWRGGSVAGTVVAHPGPQKVRRVLALVFSGVDRVAFRAARAGSQLLGRRGPSFYSDGI